MSHVTIVCAIQVYRFFLMCQGIINNPVLVSQCFSGQRRGQTVAISTHRTAARHTSLSSITLYTWSNSPPVYWLHQNKIFRSVLHHSSFLHSSFPTDCHQQPYSLFGCPEHTDESALQPQHTLWSRTHTNTRPPSHPLAVIPIPNWPSTVNETTAHESRLRTNILSCSPVSILQQRTCGEHNVSWLHTTSRCVASIMEVMRSRLFTVWQMNEDEQGRSSCEDRCTAIASSDDGKASKMRHVCN
jgi:hypothetical protein